MLTIAINAGGSSTEVLGGDANNFQSDAVKRVTLGPGNFRSIGEKGVQDLAQDIKARFDIKDPSQVRVIAGFAGAGTPESWDTIRGIFAQEGFSPPNVSITSDAGLLLDALKRKGVLIIAGTGAICMGQNGELIERSGGNGYRFCDEASGYYLGQRAINAALFIDQGLHHPPSALHKIVLDHFGVPNLEKINNLIYTGTDRTAEQNENIAALAPHVLKAAAMGDDVAKQIVGQAVEFMANHLQAVCKKLGFTETTVGLHGGLFKNPYADELIIGPLRDHRYVAGLTLDYQRLGITSSDPNPVIEAVRFVLELEKRSKV